MPTARHEELIGQLASAGDGERAQSLRYLKNCVIGNRQKKDQLAELGVVASLVRILREPSVSVADLVQACHILGSLAYGGEPCLHALAREGVTRALLDLLAKVDTPDLIEAALRALKLSVGTVKTGKNILLQDADTHRIVYLLNPVAWPTPPTSLVQAARIGQQAALFIARCSGSQTLQTRWFSTQATKELLLLVGCGFVKTQEAALEALANLCHDNHAVAHAISHSDETVAPSESSVDVLLRMLQHPDAYIRLLVASCIVNMSRMGAMTSYAEKIRLSLLPTLIRLFDCSDKRVEEQAPLVFAYLVGEDAELQTSACETGNTLLAIAAVCSLQEECRKKAVDAKVLPRIVSALSHYSPRVRTAACMCTRSLSRSVKNLRTSLVDADVATPICKLLSDPSPEVQSMALTTLCNLTVLDQNIIPQLVKLSTSEDADISMHAMWTMENMVYHAGRDVKSAVMVVLTYDRLITLIRTGNVSLQERAIGLLRNLICGKEADVSSVLEGVGEVTLLSILDQMLQSKHEKVLLQTLYIAVNMATGNEQHKQSLMENETILHGILNCLEHSNVSIREGAVWCIINLCWYEGRKREEIRGARDRIQRFRTLGVLERIRHLADDSNLNLRERVATAIDQLSRPLESMEGISTE
ncbi:armadillo-type protein [Thamnocephalis sphaerospora]|uniref:Armadillo-type protein n=1 Tax=Thamnocephalis sphaerospora TaxID=78915 RepID=A0A4P9XR16_9FUNG|nr:armadillo-type protein [Thamnocephalis sphaerospora]|eukprot:RKP07951.1 armadillo-type protein [Thamnocephalis sphaerospora]